MNEYYFAQYSSLVAATFISIISLSLAQMSKPAVSTKRLLLALIVIFTIVMGWASCKAIRKQQLEDEINAKLGTLSGKSESEDIVFEIGYSGATFIAPNGILAFNDIDTVCTAFIKNSRVYINAKIRNIEGRVVASVTKNVWQIFEPGYEYNNDGQGFELVIKGERNPIFQIDLKDKTIHVSGLFFSRHGPPGIILHEGVNGGLLTAIRKEDTVYEMPKITRIFEYPREMYLGTRRE